MKCKKWNILKMSEFMIIKIQKLTSSRFMKDTKLTIWDTAKQNFIQRNQRCSIFLKVIQNAKIFLSCCLFIISQDVFLILTTRTPISIIRYIYPRFILILPFLWFSIIYCDLNFNDFVFKLHKKKAKFDYTTNRWLIFDKRILIHK